METLKAGLQLTNHEHAIYDIEFPFLIESNSQKDAEPIFKQLRLIKTKNPCKIMGRIVESETKSNTFILLAHIVDITNGAYVKELYVPTNKNPLYKVKEWNKQGFYFNDKGEIKVKL